MEKELWQLAQWCSKGVDPFVNSFGRGGKKLVRTVRRFFLMQCLHGWCPEVAFGGVPFEPWFRGRYRYASFGSRGANRENVGVFAGDKRLRSRF